MPRGRRSVAGGNANRMGKVGRGRGGGLTAGTDSRLADIVGRYVGDLVDAVRQEVRRSVGEEVKGYLAGQSGGGTAGRTRRTLAGRKKNVVQCIAPGCPNPSKGPRFHYLCEKHKDAKKADYEAWRKARKEKQAA
jgi:hypothetical protein